MSEADDGAGRHRITLKDVARHLGVSAQTVSNALNGTGRLSGATREKVLQAVDTLGYQPHASAASLRSGRAHRLVYPLPARDLDSTNTVMLDFLQHVVTAAAEHAQQVLVIRPGGDGTAALDELVRSGSVDGVLLSGIVQDDPRVRHLKRLGVPFACFGRTEPGCPQSWVDVDNEAATREITEAVLAQGHTRVVFVGYRTNSPWDLAREAGYRSAMAGAGRRAAVARAEVGRELRAVTSALTRRPCPTAIVTGSDVLAAACYAAAHTRGLRVGADLAVSGFDGSNLSRLLVPSLSTVAIPLQAIAENLIARVLREVPNDTGEILATSLRLAESTGHAPPSPDGRLRPARSTARRERDPEPARTGRRTR